MDLLVVGSVALDTVETPVARREGVLGGSASYVSVAANRMTQSRIVAVVGQDFPAEHTELLQAQGVDTQGLYEAAGRTFRWAGRYRENMNLRDTLSTELGVFETFSPKLPENLRGEEFVFLGNIHPSVQLAVLNQLSSPRFVGLDTMNFWIEGTPDLLADVLRKVHLLLINEEEARSLSGQHSLKEAAKTILQMGPSCLVIKRGEYGALLFPGDGSIFSIPALLLDSVEDPTGAGDSFAGGFMGYVARSERPEDPDVLRNAMLAGTVMASFAVEGFSLGGLIAADDEAIKVRTAELKAMTQL